jgi:hypothetical protein
MAFIKIRPGQELGQNGVSYHPGDVVEVPDRILPDVLHKGDRCDASGVLVEASAPETDFSRFRAHEQVTLWKAELERRQAAVSEAEVKLADAEQALEREAIVASAPTTKGRKSEPQKAQTPTIEQ